MARLATVRHQAVFPEDEFNPTRVTLIGLGSGNGYIAHHLANLGVQNLHGCDFDHVSLENVSTSLYGERHVGLRKTEACAELVRLLSAGVSLTQHFGKAEMLPPLEGVVFIGVDSMKERKRIVCEQCVPQGTRIRRVFEGRISADYALLHSFDPANEEHVERWLEYWHDDSATVPDLPGCGAAKVGVGSTASLAADIAIRLFIEWFAHERERGPEPHTQVQFDLATFECRASHW